MQNILLYTELVLAVLLSLAILIQPKSNSGMGSMAGEQGEAYSTKRGAEKMLHTITVALAVLFSCVALAYHLI